LPVTRAEAQGRLGGECRHARCAAGPCRTARSGP